MNFSQPFVLRPVGTTLLSLGLALAGIPAFFFLPVAPLPQVDFPTVSVQAQLPGASPQTMATSVATPLERHLGQIADVTEITSSSSVGSTRITLQFGLDRDIDGAARDVEAGIQAARVDLPASLKANPTYRKVNPADAPIMILALTSETLDQGQMYDAASTVQQQALSQVSGIGQVVIGGSSLPAVRVEVNPLALFKYGIGLEDIRAALASANANSPKGAIDEPSGHFQIYANDQARVADQYRSLVVAYRDNAAVRLSDVAEVENSVEDLRNLGLANGRPSIILLLFKQPNANIIATVDRVKALLPYLRASIPSAINLTVPNDRTTTIRASLREVEGTLGIAIALVILVVFLFLRNVRAALIPSVTVPLSLVGTFGGMYLMGYSLDNLSLMALTICTGFVVDDAIVVLENTMRHLEAGMPRMQAALQGVREVGFTVVSMSLSLVAVFIPILLMGGIVGRLFREFAITLSMAIGVSLILSLTTTPMMCARLLRSPRAEKRRQVFAWSEYAYDMLHSHYERSLQWALRHSIVTMTILVATIALNIFLYVEIPKGFFPQQDTGRIAGSIQADQSISFKLMSQKLVQFASIVQDDPDVDSVDGYTGGSQTNSGRIFVALKPLGERRLSSEQVIARLRRKLAVVVGATMYLQSVQDIRSGGRMSNAQYQYTLQADDLNSLFRWAPKLTEALQQAPELTDVNSDQQVKGLETDLVIDRPTAARLGLTASQIDNTLYDAFGQRQVSTIYNALNQYHVVLEVAPRFWQSPETLNDIFVSKVGGAVSGSKASGFPAGTVSLESSPSATSAALNNSSSSSSADSLVANDPARNQALNALANTTHSGVSTGTAVSTEKETMVPLAAFTHFGPGSTPLSVNHQGLSASSTISFNLAPGNSLSDAVRLINRTMNQIRMPEEIHGSFAGTAQSYQQSLQNEPILVLAALVAVYIVLGILYESYIHPLTILSTLPSAGVGALLALMAFHREFSIIALIGVILLIGIVKKNAIMMIDFAISAERTQGLAPREAIYKACLLRFRPIMMTTMAALLGAAPLTLVTGNGAEIRQPLGIAIVGGLIISQALTLYTTPVVYLYFDRFGLWIKRRRSRHSGHAPEVA